MSTHSIFNHIVPQLSKFIQGLNDPRSRRNIVEALYDEIKTDPILEAYVRNEIGSGEVFRFISSTLDKPPTLVVIIDEKTTEPEEACNSIPKLSKKIITFNIFERIDAGIKNAFIFDILVEKGKKLPALSKQPPTGPITPQPEYAKPILEALIKLGGSGKVQDVLDIVYSNMKNRFTTADLEMLPSGREQRWRNQTKWMRFSLKQEGYLKPDSPHGIWEISDKGKAFLKH